MLCLARSRGRRRAGRRRARRVPRARSPRPWSQPYGCVAGSTPVDPVARRAIRAGRARPLDESPRRPASRSRGRLASRRDRAAAGSARGCRSPRCRRCRSRCRYSSRLMSARASSSGSATSFLDDEARDHAAGGVSTSCRIDAVVADERVGHRDDLPLVGRIGEDLLVAGHRGVEDDLARGLAAGAEGLARGRRCRRRARAGPARHGVTLTPPTQRSSTARRVPVTRRRRACSGSATGTRPDPP